MRGGTNVHDQCTRQPSLAAPQPVDKNMFKFCDIWCTFIGPFMFTRWSFYKLVYRCRAIDHFILALLQVHPSSRKDPLRIIRKRIRMNSRRQLCRNDAMKANQLSIDVCYIYFSLFMQNSESLEGF